MEIRTMTASVVLRQKQKLNRINDNNNNNGKDFDVEGNNENPLLTRNNFLLPSLVSNNEVKAVIMIFIDNFPSFRASAQHGECNLHPYTMQSCHFSMLLFSFFLSIQYLSWQFQVVNNLPLFVFLSIYFCVVSSTTKMVIKFIISTFIVYVSYSLLGFDSTNSHEIM